MKQEKRASQFKSTKCLKTKKTNTKNEEMKKGLIQKLKEKRRITEPFVTKYQMKSMVFNFRVLNNFF